MEMKSLKTTENSVDGELYRLCNKGPRDATFFNGCSPVFCACIKQCQETCVSEAACASSCPVCDEHIVLCTELTSPTSVGFDDEFQQKCMWCGEDSDASATVHCEECGCWYCVECFQCFHKRWKSHNLTVKDTSKRFGKDKCKMHPAYPADHWCCEQELCAECLVSGHLGHNHMLVKKEKTALSSILSISLDALTSEAQKAQGFCRELTAEDTAARRRLEELEGHVEKIRNLLKSKLDGIATRLVRTARIVTSQYRARIQSSLESVGVNQNKLQHQKRHIEQVLSGGSVREMNSVAKAFRKQELKLVRPATHPPDTLLDSPVTIDSFLQLLLVSATEGIAFRDVADDAVTLAFEKLEDDQSISPAAANLTPNEQNSTESLENNQSLSPAAAYLTPNEQNSTESLENDQSLSPAAAYLTPNEQNSTESLENNQSLSPAAAYLTPNEQNLVESLVGVSGDTRTNTKPGQTNFLQIDSCFSIIGESGRQLCTSGIYCLQQKARCPEANGSRPKPNGTSVYSCLKYLNKLASRGLTTFTFHTIVSVLFGCKK